jgi:pilus assembly protein CpaB
VARSNLSGLTSRRPFTLLGIVLALLVIAAFVLVAINASAGQTTAHQTVVVTNRDLSARIPIDASALQLKSVSVDGYPTSVYFHRIEDVTGMIPLVTIPMGEPVTSNVIAKPGTELGTQSGYLPIPSGYVAVTVPTSEQQGVGGYIQPGDYIAIIATVDVNGKIATKTIFTQLPVIRVGALQPITPGQAAPAAIASSLTVVVTACQAEYLYWFLTYASLKYALESFHDYKPGTPAPDPNCPSVDATKGVSLAQVMAAYPSLF